MTNKKLDSVTSGLVDEVCAAQGIDPRPGQKGGNREEANFLVARALRAHMAAIRSTLELPTPAPALALKEDAA